MFAQLLRSRFAQRRPWGTTQLPRGLAVVPLPLGSQYRLLAGLSLSGTHSWSLWLSPAHPRKRQHKMTQPVPPEQWFESSHPPSSQQDHRDSCAVLTSSQQMVMDPLCGQPCWMEPKRQPPLLQELAPLMWVVDRWWILAESTCCSVQGVRAALVETWATCCCCTPAVPPPPAWHSLLSVASLSSSGISDEKAFSSWNSL